MTGGVTARGLSWWAAAAGAAMAVSFALALRRRRAGLTPAPKGLLKGCLRVCVEHAQSLAVMLAAACAFPALLTPVALAGARLEGRAGGLALFLAAALAAAAGCAAAVFAAAGGVCWLALRRFQGQKAELRGLAAAAAARAREAPRWAREALRREAGLAAEPFFVPALLASDAAAAEAAARAEAFRASAPRAAAAVAPLRERLRGALTAVLCVLLPAGAGFACLPLLSSLGYAWDRAWILESYVGLWALGEAALCAALCWALLLACAALVHAAAVYAYGTGGEEVRARVLKRLKREWVWPEEGAAPPAPVAPAPARRAEPAQARARAQIVAPTPEAPSAPLPQAADLSQEPVPTPKLEEYAQERILPTAGRAELDIGAPAVPVVFVPEALAPLPRRRWTPARFSTPLYRGLLLGLSLVGTAALGLAYDGMALLDRQRALLLGRQTPAVIEALDAAPKLGVLQYTMTFTYDDGGRPERAQALVGEPARVLFVRGKKVQAHVLDRDGRRVAALDDDYGFTGQRLALLLALCGFLIVGAWSFAFRVL